MHRIPWTIVFDGRPEGVVTSEVSVAGELDGGALFDLVGVHASPPRGCEVMVQAFTVDGERLLAGPASLAQVLGAPLRVPVRASITLRVQVKGPPPVSMSGAWVVE